MKTKANVNGITYLFEDGQCIGKLIRIYQRKSYAEQFAARILNITEHYFVEAVPNASGLWGVWERMTEDNRRILTVTHAKIEEEISDDEIS